VIRSDHLIWRATDGQMQQGPSGTNCRVNYPTTSWVENRTYNDDALYAPFILPELWTAVRPSRND
jgi:hypothetical protein